MKTPELLLRIMTGIPIAFVCIVIALAGMPVVAAIPGVRPRAFFDAVMALPEWVFQEHRI